MYLRRAEPHATFATSRIDDALLRNTRACSPTIAILRQHKNIDEIWTYCDSKHARQVRCKERFARARDRFCVRVARNSDVRAPKNIFHNSLYKRRARTGIAQKRANQSRVIRCCTIVDRYFLITNPLDHTDSLSAFRDSARCRWRPLPHCTQFARRAREHRVHFTARVSFSGFR